VQGIEAQRRYRHLSRISSRRCGPQRRTGAAVRADVSARLPAANGSSDSDANCNFVSRIAWISFSATGTIDLAPAG
jgi:hypothetical protein